MRIVIETNDPVSAAAVMPASAVDLSPAAHGITDAGAGPDAAASDAPTSSSDAGGPPAWLVKEISAAEAAATGTFGVAPTPPAADVDGWEDAGGGPVQ